MNAIDDLHRVKFAHEGIHDRLVNWGRWCMGGSRGAGASPMFRHYRAPKFRNAVEEIHIPVDGLDASKIERAVAALPEKHRDSIRWFYVYSHAGMGAKRAMQGLAVTRDTLVRLIQDGRTMLRNRLDMVAPPCGTMAPQFEPASDAPRSRSEAEVLVGREDMGKTLPSREMHMV